MARILKKGRYLAPDGFPVAIVRMQSQQPMDLHAHEFVELVVVTAGSGLHRLEEEAWPVAAGDVFVINSGSAHGYRDTDRLSLVNVLYDPGRLSLPEKDLRALPGYHAVFRLEPAYRKRHRFEGRLRLATGQRVRVEAVIDALEEELTGGEAGSRFMATAHFMRLIGYLSRSFGRGGTPASESLLRVGRAIGHLETNYAQRITLDRLARVAHMSRRNFLRVFREGVGTSPIEYLLRVRIARAAELLRRPAFTVTRVAFRVGFQDSNYFARQFRRIMGMSPRAYRKSSIR